MVERIDRERFAAMIGQMRTDQWPEHWPADVRIISLEGLSLLGVDGKGGLYLDGDRLYTVRRLGRFERWTVGIGVAAAVVAAAATCVQAYPIARPWFGGLSASAAAISPLCGLHRAL